MCAWLSPLPLTPLKAKVLSVFSTCTALHLPIELGRPEMATRVVEHLLSFDCQSWGISFSKNHTSTHYARATFADRHGQFQKNISQILDVNSTLFFAHTAIKKEDALKACTFARILSAETFPISYLYYNSIKVGLTDFCLVDLMSAFLIRLLVCSSSDAAFHFRMLILHLLKGFCLFIG